MNKKSSTWIFNFNAHHCDGDATMRDLLGGKGANLAEMAQIGLPVPPGFTISTEVCKSFYQHNGSFPQGLRDGLQKSLEELQKLTHRDFGNPKAPLLLSVRSGARVSMPGMMDTILNLGLNDETTKGLSRQTHDPRFAWDSYRRFIQMYGSVVLGIKHERFEDIINRHKGETGKADDTAFSDQDWQVTVKAYKKLIKDKTGHDFPQDVHHQLWGAISAVFRSWMNPHAQVYRKLYDILADWGTAVNIQTMVFGNMGRDCATGVCFTRHPGTGVNAFFGEYLVNAQGEDVVAGIRTPQPMSQELAKAGQISMEEAFPEPYKELLAIRKKLERHYHDMQDIEFTIQQGKLYILQTRSGKRAASAALKIAVDMHQENLISKEEALLRITPQSLTQILHPILDPARVDQQHLTKGLAASPGAASGIVAFTAEKAQELDEAGKSVILVRAETSAEDVHGMHAAQGILTTRGGTTSHAAVVARGMGRPCICGASEITIHKDKNLMMIHGEIIKAGEQITIDGNSGEIFKGFIPTINPSPSPAFLTIMQWAKDVSRLGVRANAETAQDARVALQYGAQGIGLCRTEHMFFGPERITPMRQVILAETTQERQKALQRLLPYQKNDFLTLFQIMGERPVLIRLLDPPLHEFLPTKEEDFKTLSKEIKKSADYIRVRCKSLKEVNPMLGNRGCRLGILFPEIYAMQIRAIIDAAIDVMQENHQTIKPEIMIPLVASDEELKRLRALCEEHIKDICTQRNATISYKIGTMIELPRAALQAGHIANYADFFSFGTNDLTQTTLGISRDDAGTFLPSYVKDGVFKHDPFASIDKEGVGELIAIACQRAKKQSPHIKLGICGEQGGDPRSIDFFEEIGLDYVSCSPYRIPVAQLACAQTRIRHLKRG